jgi:hypothetical protein
VSGTRYDNRGRLASRTLNNTGSPISRDYTFDDLSRLAGLKATRGTTVVQDDNFGWDSADNLSFQRDLLAGRRECYSYDLRQRLTLSMANLLSSLVANGGPRWWP